MKTFFFEGLVNKLKKHYYNMNIKYKITTINFLILFIVCTLSLSAFQVASSVYDNLLYKKSADTLNLSTINVESELEKFEKLSDDAASDSYIQEKLHALKGGLEGYEKYAALNSINDRLLNNYSSKLKNVSSINLFSGEEQLSAGISSTYISEARKEYIVKKSQEKDGGIVWIEPSDEDNSLIFAREIKEIKNFTLSDLGTLVIRIDIDNIIKQKLPVFGKNNNDLIIYSKDKLVYPYSRKNNNSLFQFKDSEGYDIKTISHKKVFISHTLSEHSGWTYINIIPYQLIYKDIGILRNVILFIMALIFIGTFYISMRFARNVTKPIESLKDSMKIIESGNFDLDISEYLELKRTDEIGYLRRDFGIMVEKIRELIKENYTKQLLVKDAQFKALQHQINPHFLYNTLESINWLAKINKQDDISIMVESLGNLLRNSINNKADIVTLGDEINILRSYIAIQKIRYEERLDFNIDVNEKLMDIQIPKMAIQPIVENSINYALEKMAEPCCITVSSTETNEVLQLIISDNGPGVEEDVLEMIKVGRIKPKGLGLGLKNIDERIKIMFGDEYGVVFSSKVGVGTKVTLILPMIRRG